AALKDADLVIEAIYEDEKAKGELFAKLETVCPQKTIFASNTSSLSVEKLAKSAGRPDRFVGLHFFFHPVKNRLVEVVPIETTAPETLKRVLRYCRSLGKIPIETKDAAGFAVNRFFVPWLNEAVRLLEQGIADIPTIEEAAKRSFGIGMGPFGLMNATGVPIALHAAAGLGRALGHFYDPAKKLKEQGESNKDWPLEGKADESKLKKVSDRLQGVVFAIAGCIAEEGVATREDIDRGAKIGLRWAKGPFEMMNAAGLKHAAHRVQRICDKYGVKFPMSLRKTETWKLSLVDLAVENGVAKIVLNRPEAMNALNVELVRQFSRRLREAQHAAGARVITIEGRGKAFMAGADIKFFVDSIEKNDLDAIQAFTEAGQRLLCAIEASIKPVVALIDGPALGGGTELALACRWRVVSPKAMFRLPETSLGIYPGLGGTQRLARRIGKRLARYFVFAGAPMPAQLAYDLGVADAICPADEFDAAVAKLLESGPPAKRELAEDVVKIRDIFSKENVVKFLAGEFGDSKDPLLAKAAKGISRGAPVALKIADELIEEGLELELPEGLALELSRIKEIFKTSDAKEGLSAMLEGRRPKFQGK
ncbi:MAG: enoyl-CoA hydratase/isomerase family protein, partial [Elusimicrobiota bacterium]